MYGVALSLSAFGNTFGQHLDAFNKSQRLARRLT